VLELARGAVLNAALMSSARTGEVSRDNWRTPQNVLELVRAVAPIDLDPCTDEGNPTGAHKCWLPQSDGLVQPWFGSGLVFINFPYSQAKPWAERIAEEVTRTGVRREYIALVPARTDTGWWHKLMSTRPHRVCFWRGRLKFERPDGGPSQSAPFPSALLYWGADDGTFARVFGPHGHVVRT
jgi:site-specific DNA-methyltransferase (adenine-specific)